MDFQGEDPIHLPRHVFRLDLEGAEGDSYYMARAFPVVEDGDYHCNRNLSDLAKSVVECQLRHIEEIPDLPAAGEFPLPITFSPPYDVRMQRYRFWHTSELTDAEKGEFLDQLRQHYIEMVDPHGYEAEHPERCSDI